MSNKLKNTDSPTDAFTNESARLRWELFHRAIAHAKESNDAAMHESDLSSGDPESSVPLLTVVK
jgi:hypothetical protein